MVVKKDLSLKYDSLESILENIENLGIEDISINPVFHFFIEDRECRLEYTDQDHPIGIGTVGVSPNQTLCIDKEYYLKNKEQIDFILSKIVSKLEGTISLNGLELIDVKIVDPLISNPNVEEIRLYNNDGEAYSLSKEMYERIKQHENIKSVYTTKIDSELEENFDPIIMYNQKSLFLNYNYEALKNSSEISIFSFKDFKEEDFQNVKNLKYLNKDAVICFSDSNFSSLDRFITEFINNNITNKLEIKIDTKNKMFFNRVVAPKLINNFNSVNIVLEYNEKYSLEEYLGYEKRLDDLVAPAIDLSPLERYLYAYNVVKKFKPYKENEEDAKEARSVYKLLDNDYMVCVGYSHLLEDLLGRLGIVSEKIGVTVNTGFDRMEKDAQEVGDRLASHGYHARLQVKIEDPKYNVNGIYIADPTWDNIMDKDSYLHALMDVEEYNSMNRENFTNGYDRVEILEATTIQEFYDRVNYFIDLDKRNTLKKKKEGIITSYDKLDDPNIDIIRTKINEVLKIDYKLGNSNFYVGNLDRELFIKRVVIDVIRDYKYNKMTIEGIDELIKERIDRNIKSEKIKDFQVETNTLSKLMLYIEKFNPTLHQDLKSKYPQVFSSVLYRNPEEFISQYSRAIEEIASYVTSMNNNKVSGKTILEAVKEIYKASNVKNIEEKLEETRKDNEKAYDRAFPQRMKITEESEEVYINEENKFTR